MNASHTSEGLCFHLLNAKLIAITSTQRTCHHLHIISFTGYSDEARTSHHGSSMYICCLRASYRALVPWYPGFSSFPSLQIPLPSVRRSLPSAFIALLSAVYSLTFSEEFWHILAAIIHHSGTCWKGTRQCTLMRGNHRTTHCSRLSKPCPGDPAMPLGAHQVKKVPNTPAHLCRK